MIRLMRLTGRLENGFAIAILAVIGLLPVLEMTGRKFFSRGVPGSGSMVQHLTLWIAFLGAALAARSGNLLALSTAGLLPERLRSPVRCFTSGAGALVCLWLAVASIQWILLAQKQEGQIAWGIPFWLAVAIMPLALSLIAVRIVWLASEYWKSRLATLAGVVAGAWLLHGPGSDGVQWAAMGLLLLACALGMPLFTVMGGAALLLFWKDGIPLAAVPDEMYKLSASEFMPAIPMFTLGGYILAAGGASSRLMEMFTALFGWLPGGLAIVITLLLAFFTPLTGASGVTILSLGGLLFPLLVKARYPDHTSLGLVTVSGSIGLLLPPSLPVILYAITAQIPVPSLFLASLLPGVLLIAAVAAWGAREGRLHKAASEPFRLRRAVGAVWQSKWELLLPVVVLASYFGGYATLVETAAITVLYALLVNLLIFRDPELRKALAGLFVECATVVGGFLIIVSAALAFTNFLVTAEVPMRALEWVRLHIESRLVFLLALNLFLIAAGALMDIYSAILVVVPLITPMAAAYGVDPIHLGVIFLVNMELGYLMPPMGENLFLSAVCFDKPLTEVYRSVFPFLIILMGVVLVITYMPSATLLR